MGGKIYENKFVLDEIKDKVAIALGITGVGKSSFINSITKKKKCKVGNTSDACTQEVLQVDVFNEGYNFYFVDTPGLDDGKGDDKNIAQLDNLKSKYPRINVFLICLKFNDLRLSNSLKESLKKFMGIFPTSNFWEHVLIIRTHSSRHKKFEKEKKKIEGKLLEGIIKDHDLNDYMEKNNINIPTKLKEFFVDSDDDLESIDDETKSEFQSIFEEISKIHPIYKEVTEEIKEYIEEKKDGELSFIHIKTEKYIHFKDFDGKEHTTIQNVGDEKYNLDGIRPLFNEVKREQAKEPRGILCWSHQFSTRYFLVKIYEFGGNRKRVECDLDKRWEYKNEEAEIAGENHRQKLNNEYCQSCCQC